MQQFSSAFVIDLFLFLISFSNRTIIIYSIYYIDICAAHDLHGNICTQHAPHAPKMMTSNDWNYTKLDEEGGGRGGVSHIRGTAMSHSKQSKFQISFINGNDTVNAQIRLVNVENIR